VKLKGTSFVYWYNERQILHTTFEDGLQRLEFKETGQVELVYPDGTQEIRFPDGTVRFLYKDGRVGVLLFTDVNFFLMWVFFLVGGEHVSRWDEADD
jgi:hypothetical protein